MNATGEERHGPRQHGDARAVIRAIQQQQGWVSHVAGGGAIITNVSQTGMQVALDETSEPGTFVHIVIPAYQPIDVELMLTAKVVWSRRNDMPTFGRYTCGLIFSPELQPDVWFLLNSLKHSTPQPTQVAEAVSGAVALP